MTFARSNRGQTLSAALTALAFVLSSLFGVLHDATTIHVRCAQHGELMDGGPGGARADAQEAPVVRELPAEPTRASHEHCALASAMRESRVAASPPTLAPAPVAVARRTAAVVAVAVARDRGLYRTAPKTSPPA